MPKKRTHVDYSKHEINITESQGLFVIRFRKPNTVCEAVTFINTNGILAVTGDFGNWIFCREFWPSPEGGVSDHYWCEKLQIASTQNPYDYDKEETENTIRQRIADEECTTEEKEYYEHLLNYVDESEEVYLAEAHGSEMPQNMDHESVPHEQKLKFWLAAVFDAFDEICLRMKAEAVTS